MLHRIFIANRNRRPAGLLQEFGRIPKFDVTALTHDPRLLPLSPFYPHGRIPVAFTDRKLTGVSLEAIWNGLKVFEHEGADFTKFECESRMVVRRPGKQGRGRLLGFQQGSFAERPLLTELEARGYIYAPTFWHILAYRCTATVDFLRTQIERVDIVLLDHSSEHNRRDLEFPLMTSVLLRDYLLGRYPKPKPEYWQPFTEAERRAERERLRAEQTARMQAGMSANLGRFG